MNYNHRLNQSYLYLNTRRREKFAGKNGEQRVARDGKKFDIFLLIDFFSRFIIIQIAVKILETVLGYLCVRESVTQRERRISPTTAKRFLENNIILWDYYDYFLSCPCLDRSQFLSFSQVCLVFIHIKYCFFHIPLSLSLSLSPFLPLSLSLSLFLSIFLPPLSLSLPLSPFHFLSLSLSLSLPSFLLSLCLPNLFFFVTFIDYPLAVRSRVRIHQPFSRTFFVFFSEICQFECNTTSDLLNRTI